ncbi:MULTISPECIES: alanine/glycine:cation symporter family protein [Clostridium]|jgi:AGCS family alanine or glycine:cation symporter|uniref:Sodium:alanine symporter family protein n=2 Tax=Clostridium TaxID=1485 RepID=A0A7X5PD76_CLOSG|nr:MULTISPECIES: sodium:alanine symporter family protein [Clostridium]AJD30340.1 amino acid carrier family protein [Clostridium botulinum Prevot_594]AVP59756.1 sodium:alanine symporter family protein [Clostridium botulinum]AKC61831.1 sodium:alanine symporter family protein [Clostridium sporogenes]AKJ89139.1 amino acid carrier protein [Clostridium sporogenes]AVP63510.1 sodium:alanine symporter family protein [Clostridium botulinum]
MDAFINFISKISNWIWGAPMLILLVGGGIILTFTLKFFQIEYLPYIMKETFGKMFSKPTEGEGTITPFQAACSALASTVGAANIIGVPVAIAFGGPGAIFWMWVVAILGQATKFSEIILGLKYREKNEEGNYVGGPVYYLKKGLKSPFLATMCSFCFMIEIIPSISTQSLSVCQTAETIGLPKIVTAIIVTVLVALVVYGGIKRIGQVTEKLVPIMALVFIICSLIIILFNISKLPHAFGLIFKGAFTPQAAVGGFGGATLAQTLRWGTARGTYSNEAGMGSAPIAHSAAVTDHPVRQAFWGIFEIMVDTIIICTLTALVVITTGMWNTVPGSQAASMPSMAFQNVFGKAFGGAIVSISILLFVLSTIIVIVYYCEKQAEALFGLAFSKVIRVVCLAAIIYGAIGELEFLFALLDILLALVVIPNMIGLIAMRNEIKELKEEFFSDPKYYPGAKTSKSDS